jgi:hypothetical protein
MMRNFRQEGFEGGSAQPACDPPQKRNWIDALDAGHRGDEVVKPVAVAGAVDVPIRE